jgi:hypothetical protein
MTESTRSSMPRPTILAYYFPDWHVDSRNESWFGSGWTEWQLLQGAEPRFAGHRQPRVPADGYLDESDPEVAAAQIVLAADHGIDGFLVDYYWYDDGPYLQGALDRGLLAAPNTDKIQFALMWANHELVDIFPYHDPSNHTAERLKDGAIDRPTFERMVEHIVTHYFVRDNYLKVDGKPWFSIYEVGNLIQGLGGVAETADALAWFRARVIEAGFPGLHLDMVVWGFGVLPTAVLAPNAAELIAAFDVDSATSYVWIHHVDVQDFAFPVASVADLQNEAFAKYEAYANELPVPFHPNVTVGWDSSPRTAQGLPYTEGRYPWTPTWDQSPSQFEAALVRAQDFIDRHSVSGPVLTINAWNEWTEGSYLLPDNDNGLGYLEAVRRVFGLESPAVAADTATPADVGGGR